MALLPVGEAVGHEQAARCVDRPEVRDRPLDDAQAMAAEFQIADHFRIEQAHRVRRDRVAKSRRERLGHGGAADHVVGFEHDHAAARPAPDTRRRSAHCARRRSGRRRRSMWSLLSWWVSWAASARGSKPSWRCTVSKSHRSKPHATRSSPQRKDLPARLATHSAPHPVPIGPSHGDRYTQLTITVAICLSRDSSPLPAFGHPAG